MEPLKKALGRITTRWFRSELVRETPEPTIAHLFVCPHCKRTERTGTKFTPVDVPPNELAAPPFGVRRVS